MVLEVDCLEQLSNQILNPFSMHLGKKKIEKELLDPYGLQELMQHLDS